MCGKKCLIFASNQPTIIDLMMKLLPSSERKQHFSPCSCPLHQEDSLPTVYPLNLLLKMPISWFEGGWVAQFPACESPGELWEVQVGQLHLRHAQFEWTWSTSFYRRFFFNAEIWFWCNLISIHLYLYLYMIFMYILYLHAYIQTYMQTYLVLRTIT